MEYKINKKIEEARKRSKMVNERRNSAKVKKSIPKVVPRNVQVVSNVMFNLDKNGVSQWIYPDSNGIYHFPLIDSCMEGVAGTPIGFRRKDESFGVLREDY